MNDRLKRAFERALVEMHPVLRDDDPFSPDLSDMSDGDLEKLARQLLHEEEPVGLMHLLLEALQQEQIKKRQAQAKATTHPVSGLPNRHAFDMILQYEVGQRIGGSAPMNASRVRRRPGTLSLLYMDLSLFKRVNDIYGHDAGDRTLKEVGILLGQNCRSNDLVVHLGGDEFAILLPRTSQKQAAAVKQRIQKAFEDFGFDYNGHRIHVGLNTGLAVYKPDETPVEFCNRAEKAMRDEKEKDPVRAQQIRYLVP